MARVKLNRCVSDFLEFIEPVAYFTQSISDQHLLTGLIDVQYPLLFLAVFLPLFNNLDNLSWLGSRLATVELEHFLILVGQGIECFIPETRRDARL